LRTSNLFYGDARGNMSDQAQGGNDTFIFSGSSSLSGYLFYGDAGGTMSGDARGGNDTIIAGANGPAVSSTLVGDAQTMSDNAHGGNDTLVSGTGTDQMWGDAQVISGNAQGGNDTFVFKPNSGHDTIEDFGQGQLGSQWGTDHIDVTALGIHAFSELNISAFDPATHQSIITFSRGNDLVVHSQIALSENDFLFIA
jgi:hypothetical protein